MWDYKYQTVEQQLFVSSPADLLKTNPKINQDKQLNG